jgi:hypothetical protein
MPSKVGNRFFPVRVGLLALKRHIVMVPAPQFVQVLAAQPFVLDYRYHYFLKNLFH